MLVAQEKRGTVQKNFPRKNSVLPRIIADHLGSVRVTLDQNGNIDSWTDYYPFGKEARGSSTSNRPKEQFTGKERDSEIGLDYFGARYYNPDIVRWTSVDPLWEKHPDWNPYNYVLGNPVILVDPDGKQVVAWALDQLSTSKPTSAGGQLSVGLAQGVLSAASDNISMFMGMGESIINQGEKLLQGDIKGAMQESAAAKTYEGLKQLGSAAISGDVQAIGQVVGMVGTMVATGKLAAGKPANAAAAVEKVTPGFLVDEAGQAFPVPQGSTGPVPVINSAGNQTGVAFTGGTGDVATMRVMNPTKAKGNSPGYPHGYVKYENSSGQPLKGPYGKQTGSHAESHHPLKVKEQ